VDRRTRQELIERLNRDGSRIARVFGLRYRVIEAERANVRRRYGVCYSDGTIRIRLNHAVTGNPLKYSSLVDTLCHELAHLRHFNHGPRFKRFYLEILEWSRGDGIYRPTRRRAPSTPLAEPLALPLAAAARSSTGGDRVRPERVAGPEQLSLFG
jgi:hypothetical protein